MRVEGVWLWAGPAADGLWRMKGRTCATRAMLQCKGHAAHIHAASLNAMPILCPFKSTMPRCHALPSPPLAQTASR